MKAPTIKVQGQKKPDRPAQENRPERRKGLIRRIMEIVINDIKHPSRIFEKEKKVIMPESKETWKDWEGQI